MSLRPVRTALEEIQQGTAPVFVGPWGDTTGNELLYWIPFVRWIAATYGLRFAAPPRVMVWGMFRSLLSLIRSSREPRPAPSPRSARGEGACCRRG